MRGAHWCAGAAVLAPNAAVTLFVLIAHRPAMVPPLPPFLTLLPPSTLPRGALAHVHWWYLPDSYDELIPRTQVGVVGVMLGVHPAG